MPTYEYACASCGAHVEVYQRFSDEPLTECGVCGGPLRKVFHPAGILFKGSGFYKTDSRAGAGAKSTGDSSKGAGASGDSSKPKTGEPTPAAGKGSGSSSTPASSSSASGGKEQSA